jgi:hypothetical protein
VPEDCPAVRARVTRQGDALTVVLRDPDGRSAGRRLADARIAAAWIESWMSPDLGAPLLAPRPAPPLAAPAAAAVPVPAVDVVRPADRAESDPRLTLGVGSRSLYAGDGSSWRSIDVAACARLGFACVGLTGSVADNTGFSANDGLTEAKRRAIDLLAIARVPIRVGRATVSPGVGLGVGWLRTERDESAEQQFVDDPNCMTDPATGMECPPIPQAPYYIGDLHHAATFGVRGQLSVALSVPIGGPFALEVGAGLDLAPFAHRDPFPVATMQDDGTDPGGGENGGDPTDPDGSAGDVPSDPFTDLPGEPDHSGWWGISLRVGGW